MGDYKEELSSVASDCSFVILGSESPSPGVDGTENLDESFHKVLSESSAESLKSMENAISALNHNSAVYQENPNDIQQKLDQLVKDNLLLKETLNQSNMAMKNQFSTLTLWYDEVMKTYESHKQKFMEGQEQILKLQLENANLKKEIEEKLQPNNVSSRNCNTITVNLGSDDADAVKKNNESFQEKLKTARENDEKLYLKNEELGKKLNNLLEEKLLLEKKYNELLQENDKMKKNAEIRNDKCNKCQSSLDSNFGNTESSSRPLAVGVFSRFSSFSHELGAEERCLKENVEKLKKELKKEQETFQQTSAEMKKMKIEYEELVKEKVSLQKALKTCKTIVEQFGDQVKCLNVQIKIKENTLQSKTRELELVKKEMEKLLLDCEEVAILRAQVELYQNDFNEERIAREKAVGAREEMAEELRHLKRMLEKEGIKEEVKKEESRTSNENNVCEEDAKDVCPLCLKRFPVPQELQTHFNDCLEVFGFP